MFKQVIFAVCAFCAAVNFAFAGVEVNTADRAALDGIKEIGPKTAAAIVAERNKSGPFKDWDDLVKRVKGIGPGNAAQMSAAGLTVNNQSQAHATAPTTRKQTAKASNAMSKAPGTAAAAQPAVISNKAKEPAATAAASTQSAAATSGKRKPSAAAPAPN